jgi:hypothetical protein
MPTPITDDELFTYAERVKGKVVVITGASELAASITVDNIHSFQALRAGLGRRPR